MTEIHVVVLPLLVANKNVIAPYTSTTVSYTRPEIANEATVQSNPILV
jgi:hypothetical protein